MGLHFEISEYSFLREFMRIFGKSDGNNVVFVPLKGNDKLFEGTGRRRLFAIYVYR